MKIASALPKNMVVTVRGKPPAVMGGVEVVFPPRAVVVQSNAVMDLPTDDALMVLEKFGQLGIVAVEGPGKADEEAALVKAKSIRMNFLEQRINQFRMVNAMRRVSNLELLLPDEQMRGWLRELKALRAELIEADKELLGFDEAEKQQAIQDVALSDFHELGLNEQVMPLVPGVPNELLETLR